MEITNMVVVPVPCHSGGGRGIVRVDSDEGYTGYGEMGEAATGDLGRIMGERWKPLLVGRNPLNLEPLLRELWARSRFVQPMGGVVGSALSGVEFALLDLTGKALGIPVYQVVGGAYRTEIRVYQDTAGGPDIETYTANAVAAVQRGFDAVKFDLDSGVGAKRREAGYDPYNESVSREELVRMAATVAAIRDAIGADVDLAIDLHMRYNTPSGIRIAKAMEPYDLLWLEEPVPPENVAALRAVTRATSTPICAGENLYSKWGFRELVERQAANIIMPDVAQVGGIIETKRIADLADGYYIPVAPHNNCGPFATIAMAHLCASIPNFLVLEWHGARVENWDRVVRWDGPIVDRGCVRLSAAPGMGYALDEAEVRRRTPDAEALFA